MSNISVLNIRAKFPEDSDSKAHAISPHTHKKLENAGIVGKVEEVDVLSLVMSDLKGTRCSKYQAVV